MVFLIIRKFLRFKEKVMSFSTAQWKYVLLTFLQWDWISEYNLPSPYCYLAKSVSWKVTLMSISSETWSHIYHKKCLNWLVRFHYYQLSVWMLYLILSIHSIMDLNFFPDKFFLKYIIPYNTLELVNWHLLMQYRFVKALYTSKI